MKQRGGVSKNSTNRRSFLKNGLVGAGATALGTGLLPGNLSAFDEPGGPPITKGDIAILRFLSALEQVEQDLWIQYAELGGPTKNVPSSIGLSGIDLKVGNTAVSTGLSTGYVTALQVLDTDMPQYIADNTDDEISHHRFLNNYVQTKGGKPVDLSGFALLEPSKVTGVPQNLRLTNLKHLTVDTSWWMRYRSSTLNPDLGDTFENAVPDLANRPHRAIPLDNNDAALNPDGTVPDPLQAIASTAGFHFGFIEQGGSSLYPSLAQKVTNLEVLRILLSIGPTETMHFQVWHDKAGNAPALTTTDPTFPNLNSGKDPNPKGTSAIPADDFQTNLIMPEPTFFLDKNFGPVSIIRPTDPRNPAMGAVKSLVDDGLFFDPKTGQDTAIVGFLTELAEEADEARRR